MSIEKGINNQNFEQLKTNLDLLNKERKQSMSYYHKGEQLSS